MMITADSFLNGPKGSFILVDCLFATLAIVLQSLVLHAALHSRFDLVGYRHFLISHQASGLCLSAVNWLSFLYQGIIMPSLVNNQTLSKCSGDFIRSLQLVGYFASLFNIAAMSIDHFIGILHPIQYAKLAKLSRRVVLFIWILAIAIGFSDYPVTTLIYLNSNSEDLAMLNSNSNNNNNNEIQVSSPAVPTADMADILWTAKPAEISTSSSSDLLMTTVNTAEPNSLSNLTATELETLLDSLTSGRYSTDRSNLTESESQMLDVLISLHKNVSVKYVSPAVGWCWHHSRGKAVLEVLVMALTLIFLVLLIICYSKIFRQVRVVANISMKTVRKLVATTVLLLTAFTLCWTPFMAIELLMVIWMTWLCQNNNCNVLASEKARIYYTIHNVLNSAIIIYPLLDSLIYTIRIGVIRKRVLWDFGRCFPCLRSYVARLISSQRSSGAANNAYKIPRRSSIDYAVSSNEKRSAIRQEMLPFLYRTSSCMGAHNNLTATNSVQLAATKTTTPTTNGVELSPLAAVKLANGNGHATLKTADCVKK